MAPSRGKGKTRAVGARSAPSRAARSTRATRNDTADVYQEMLAEEAARSPSAEAPERPLKRRRVATGVRIPTVKPAASSIAPPSASSPATSLPESTAKGKGKARERTLQTIEASSDDGSEDESEFAFEDVDLDQPGAPGPPAEPADDDGIADVSISVNPSTIPKSRAQTRRKPASSAEKALRLLVHKAHVLCLLGHGMYVNTWCNDINVQQHLHPLLSRKALTYLRGKEDYSQFQRDRSFREGLEQASDIFRAHFKVNASGMRRAIGTIDGEENEADSDVAPTSRHDLITAAREMEGSQDTGNQLFCALLRSAGVDARLVFSMQPLPLASAQAKTSTPQKPTKPVIRAMPPYADPTTSDPDTEDSAITNSSTIGKVPSARRRLGQPSLKPEQTRSAASAAPRVRKKPVRKLDYPIFWVEAFNTAHQKWTPVDPLVTRTIGKPSKFEPPSSYAANQTSYVVAFEEDSVARDVTRRYTKAYIAKTRRNRVESTENGAQWFKKALRLFRRRGGMLDRDQTEDAELNQKEAREGLPGNVQDFKDHPVYALERHLKRHEIIEPKREVGKVNAGTAAKPRMEPVYRRSDVLVCRSGDKWYRLGREIQQGQAPIKHVPTRNPPGGRRSLSPDADTGEVAGAGMTALYAHYQTEAYIAPPVVKGKVPRNAFGNLDIYVPSMVPPGGTHIRHALAQQAARSLRVDYADAVTGFQFKGRHGTAIIQGAIVATQYAEAVEAVIDGLLNDKMEEQSLARSAVALRMWKRFLTGLRIKERISSHAGGGEAEDVREEIDREVEEQDEIAEAGGFFAEEPAMPTAGKFSLVEMARVAKQTPKTKGRKRKEESESEIEAEFAEPGSEVDGASLPTRRSKRARTKVVHEDDEDETGDDGVAGRSTMRTVDHDDDAMDDDGGGFLRENEDEEYGGGGSVPEDADDPGESAGVFVPGDDNIAEAEEGGGGFLADDEEENAVPLTAGPTDEGGGGFLPETENEDDQSGGFAPEAEGMGSSARLNDIAEMPATTLETTTATHNSSSPVRPNENKDIASQAVNRNVDASAPEEVVSMHGALQHDQPEQQTQPPPSTEMEIDKSAPDFTSTELAADHPAAHEPDEDARDSDQGSMLSHDPEDEDAEPDWLESD